MLQTFRKFSYVVPVALIAFAGRYTSISWWALAILIGGSMYAWDRLWGSRDLLNAKLGLQLAGVGVVCMGAAAYFADGLGVSLAEFVRYAHDLRGRRSRIFYQLPSVGLGLIVYGLHVWSRAWLIQRDERSNIFKLFR